MSIRSRLQRLEKRTHGADRCPLCRDRPEWVLQRYLQEKVDAEPTLARDPAHSSAEPCSRCGWRPMVTKVIETIICCREELADLPEPHDFLQA
jgi:hypothetical protein